jgi:hypothetical protein
VQRTSTTHGLKNCPSSEDFVSCNGLRPRRASRICPSSEDFVSCNGLRPRRASRICPSSEDFVSYNGLRPVGPQNSAPRRRTLSRATDFDHAGPQDLPLVGGLCLVKTDFGRTNRARTTKQDEPTRTMPMARTDGSSKREETNRAVITWRMAEDFCVGRLVDAMVVFACRQSSRGSMKML